MKIEEVITCLEEVLNEDVSINNRHCLVLHKSIEPTTFNAYNKYIYRLYSIIKGNKVLIAYLLHTDKKVDKNHELNIIDKLDKEFIKLVIKLIGTNFKKLKDKNYETIKV